MNTSNIYNKNYNNNNNKKGGGGGEGGFVLRFSDVSQLMLFKHFQCSVQDGIYARRKAHMRSASGSEVSQCCQCNTFSVDLFNDDTFSSFQGRQTNTFSG